MPKQKILCYGDSNTWGYVPNANGYTKTAVVRQYAPEQCWWYPLTRENRVMVNGLCGRTINNDDPRFPGRNASRTLRQDLPSQIIFDTVIIQLGTNDCKAVFHNSVVAIKNNLAELIDQFREIYPHAQYVIISPALNNENTAITQKYYRGAWLKTLQLDSLYREVAQEQNLAFVSGLACEIGEDGEHLTEQGHRSLGRQVLCAINALQNVITTDNGSQIDLTR